MGLSKCEGLLLISLKLILQKPSHSALCKSPRQESSNIYSMQDSGSDTDNASVVFLSTCEEDKVKENEIQERSRNTGHSREFNVIDEGYFLLRVIWSKFSTYKEII